jgi:hypothetical protein
MFDFASFISFLSSVGKMTKINSMTVAAIIKPIPTTVIEVML